MYFNSLKKTIFITVILLISCNSDRTVEPDSYSADKNEDCWELEVLSPESFCWDCVGEYCWYACGNCPQIVEDDCDFYEYFGYCYKKTNNCSSDCDCPDGWCNLLTLRCVEWSKYLSNSDGFEGCIFEDTGDLIVINHTVHGEFRQPPARCQTNSDCDSGFYCRDNTYSGYCQEICCE